MAPKFSLLSGVFLLFFSANPFGIHSRSLNFTLHNAEMLKALEGSEMGQELEGIRVVKNHLKTYGYLSGDASLDNLFDETLEPALRRYQGFYGLKVTGRIDSDTIKSMTSPRCGVPDFAPSNRTSFTPDYAFFDRKPRWPPSKRLLLYSLLSGVDVIPTNVLRTTVDNAFAKWAAVTKFSFRQSTARETPDLTIGFFRGDHGDGAPFDGLGGALAHAAAPTIGLFHYDADESWSTNPRSDQFDLETVAVHEIGHLLGLAHSTVPDAVMFPTAAVGKTKRDLRRDDINGIRALYPDG